MDKEALIKSLNAIEPKYEHQDFVDAVADFIIEDRKRIVEPLRQHITYDDNCKYCNAMAVLINQTLKNTGIEVSL